MGVNFQTTSPLIVCTRFTPKKSCIFLGWVSTKVAQRIVKFWIFDIFFFLVIFWAYSMVVNGES